MKLATSVDGRLGELEFTRGEGACSFRYTSGAGDSGKREALLAEVEPGIYSVLLDAHSYEVKIVTRPDGYYVDIAGRRFDVEVRDPRSLIRTAASDSAAGRQTVAAPMPGKVVRVLVKPGDPVEAGAGLVVVEAMKMQNELKAPKSGRVVQLMAEPGATVKAGEALVFIE